MDRIHPSAPQKAKAVLQVQDLQVYYGESHALQGVSLTLERGVLSVVGRNGMGKTTLCNAIVGLMPVRSGSIRFEGRELVGLEPHQIARAGVGFVPQGRRLWPSLSVDETLRLERARQGRVDDRARLFDLPTSCRAARQRRRPAFRRRAADAGDRSGASRQSPPSRHGRADRGACPDDCRTGARSSHSPRARGGHRHPCRRAEHRRRHLRFGSCRDHGERTRQPHHGREHARRRP